MEPVPHLKPLESYSEVKSSTDLLRNPDNKRSMGKGEGWLPPTPERPLVFVVCNQCGQNRHQS